MDFLELINKRRACHNFVPNKTISDDDLTELIQQTSLTPSGYNAQPWEFIIIKEKENLEKVSEIAFKQDHVKDASSIIVVLADREVGRNVDQLLADWLRLGYCTEEEMPAYRNSIAKNRQPHKKEKMALRNAMLASMTLIYAAENMGYATCPIMGFSQKDLITHLNIPEDRPIALMIAIGYQDKSKTENERLPRKNPADMIHWESF